MHAPSPDTLPAGSAPDPTALLEALRSAQRFVLSGHVRPDGDCLGAQLALSRLLTRLGKEVWIVNPDPPEARYGFLAEHVRYRSWTGGDLPVHDAAVLLDFSDPKRLGPLEAALFAAPSKKLVVDHHVHEGRVFWDAAYIDVRAAATGLLVRRLARALGVPLDAVSGLGIFTSLVTDTGWFKYSNTDPETLAVAAEVVAAGLEPHVVYNALYQQRSREHPVHVGKLLARTEYLAQDRLALVAWPLAEVADSNLVDTDEVLDILRSVRAVEVVLFLREMKSGEVKLSARSKSDYDVQALCAGFGGGGHKKASGAVLRGTLDEVRKSLVEAALDRFAPGGALTR